MPVEAVIFNVSTVKRKCLRTQRRHLRALIICKSNVMRYSLG